MTTTQSTESKIRKAFALNLRKHAGLMDAITATAWDMLQAAKAAGWSDDMQVKAVTGTVAFLLAEVEAAGAAMLAGGQK